MRLDDRAIGRLRSLAGERAAQDADVAPPGALVADRYEIVRPLGEGGMGTVYEARNVVTGRSVALKMPRAKHCDDPAFRRRFLREARAASALSHPNVIDILDVAQGADERPVMVMELLRGKSLAEHLRERGRLELGEAASFLVPVLDALRLAHERGVVHRDFKPENIFLSDAPGGGTMPKLLDFGIAKVAAGAEPATADTSRTATGAMLGTPYYMAPEQVSGVRDTDQKVDVWAAGAVLYECLAGQRPFRGDNFGQIFAAILQQTPAPLAKQLADLPADVDAAVTAALTRDRELRPGSLADLIDALAPFVGADVRRTTATDVWRDPRTSDDQAETIAATDPDAADAESAPTLAASRGSQPGAPAASGTLGGAETANRSSSSQRPWVAVVSGIALLVAGAAYAGRWLMAEPGAPNAGSEPAPSGASAAQAGSVEVAVAPAPPPEPPALADDAPAASSTAPPPVASAEPARKPRAPAPAAQRAPGSATSASAKRASAPATTAPPTASAAPTSPGGLLRDPRY